MTIARKFDLRKVHENELEQQLSLLNQAKLVLKERNIPQWQVGEYPSMSDLQQDFALQQSYGYFAGDTLAATAAVSAVADELYDDERFTKNDQYLIIHRVAVSLTFAGQGIGAKFLQAIIEDAKEHGICDLRIDTHPRNFAMQKTILRAGFQQIGELILPGISDPERIVYQVTTN